MGIVKHHAAANGTLSPELPEELVCRILAYLPLNNHKFRLQAVLPTWRNAMYRPESHSYSPCLCDWNFNLPPSLPSRLLRVLPIIPGTLLSSRFGAQGIEHLYHIARFKAENLEHCLPLPGLQGLHCYGGSALPETLGRLSVVFPSLKHLKLEEGSYTERFLQNDLSKLTQLEEFRYRASALDNSEEDIPAICAPRLCQICLIMGCLSRQLVPQCTALNLSSLTVVLSPEDDCVVRMTQFSGCVALQYLTYRVLDLEDPEGDSDGSVTGITVAFTGFNSLPVCLEAVHIEADKSCEVIIAPALGWASVQVLRKSIFEIERNVNLTSTHRVQKQHHTALMSERVWMHCDICRGLHSLPVTV